MTDPAVFGPIGIGPGAPQWRDTSPAFWREGNAIVIPKNYARLPDRCVVCNEPAHGNRMSQRFYWHHPAVYLTLLAGILIYAVVAAIVRKDALVEFGICPAHKSRRLLGLLIAWVGFLGSFLSMFMFLGPSMDGLIISILGMIAFPIIGGRLLARVAAPKHIDEFYIRLKVGTPFLNGVSSDPPQWLFGGHPQGGNPHFASAGPSPYGRR